MTKKWIDDGKLRWCWLELGATAIMLQEFGEGQVSIPASRKLGDGVSIAFQCEDALALYRDFRKRGLKASKPFVGNGLWATMLSDPDGYKLEFASPAAAPEETEYEG